MFRVLKLNLVVHFGNEIRGLWARFDVFLH
jgi:hypothetical protein